MIDSLVSGICRLGCQSVGLGEFGDLGMGSGTELGGESLELDMETAKCERYVEDRRSQG